MNFLINWITYISARILVGVFSILKPESALLIARIIARLIYMFSFKYKRIAYVNLRRVFAEKKSRKDLESILKKSFINLIQDIVETFRLSKIDSDYINKYIKLEGVEYIDQVLKAQKGVILVGSHFGSWEMANVIFSLLGYDYNVFAKEQARYNKTFLYLNKLRKDKGIKVYMEGNALLKIAHALKQNKVVVMVADHGGKNGVVVPFFDIPVPTPSGAVRLALRFDTSIMLCSIRRIKGPYHILRINPLSLTKATSLEDSLKINLNKINAEIEDLINRYPEQNLWRYRRWKYSALKRVLVLSDDKAGHMNQSRAIVDLLGKGNNIIEQKVIRVKFKHRFYKVILRFFSLFISMRMVGSLRYLKFALEKDSFERLIRTHADIIISAGSSLAAVNLYLKRENQARSICIMNPGFLRKSLFDLIIAPRHDPLSLKENIVFTDAAVNRIDEDFLQKGRIELEGFLKKRDIALKPDVLGVFFGGDTKAFKYKQQSLIALIEKIKSFIKGNEFDLFFTTSRRTSVIQERLFEGQLKTSAKFLVVANKNNPEYAFAGILAISTIILVSAESISMVSEAVAGSKKVVVFLPSVLSLRRRHKIFLDNLKEKGLIAIADENNLYEVLVVVSAGKISSTGFSDRDNIINALREKIL
ncbi:MAG: ELM1/GtrOC1 family putative glycosyltransferase [Candidatus Gygaella obscura]|nr:ELM1/GtrOC1 family putative glycosyltransferase [Candidatus Gygaella obscura]